MATRFREIEVSGSYQSMGRQIGEAVAQEMHQFVEISYERVSQTTALSREFIQKTVAASMPFVEDYCPELLLELEGMSDSSGIELSDLMFLQIRNQLTPDMDRGCTAFSIGDAVAASGNPLVGQNWDSDPELDAATIVLTRRPLNRPAFITVTQAGLIAYIGFSEAGVGACLNTLPAPSRSVGVPHYFTLRRIFEARSLERCVSAVSSAHRVIPANIMLATPDGPANLEITIDSVKVLRPGPGHTITHTNHCLHPDLVSINQQFDELIQSGPRLCRIDQLLRDQNEHYDSDGLESVLSDHEGYPRSICRHANDHPRHGHWTTVFSVIMSPAIGEMRLARGNPCQMPFETYVLEA